MKTEEPTMNPGRAAAYFAAAFAAGNGFYKKKCRRGSA